MCVILFLELLSPVVYITKWSNLYQTPPVLNFPFFLLYFLFLFSYRCSPFLFSMFTLFFPFYQILTSVLTIMRWRFFLRILICFPFLFIWCWPFLLSCFYSFPFYLFFCLAFIYSFPFYSMLTFSVVLPLFLSFLWDAGLLLYFVFPFYSWRYWCLSGYR